MTATMRALYAFYSSFGLPAYPEGDVPSSAVLPYITYTLVEPDWHYHTTHQARVWYRSESFAAVAAKADEIAARVGEGVTLKADAGYITLAPGQPYMQRMDVGAPEIKVIYINFDMGGYVAQGGA